MNSNDATVTTVCDSTDSTAAISYKGSRPVTGCKPMYGCCRCNNKNSCQSCSCVKAGNICTNCQQPQQVHCMNDKHNRNTSFTSNTITINSESTNVLANLLANSTLTHANQVTQSAASHAFAFSDKPVPDCKHVSDCFQSSDKSGCRHGRGVKVGNTCTNFMPLQCGHSMNNKHSWNTSLMSNTSTINTEITNVRSNQLASLTPPSTS